MLAPGALAISVTGEACRAACGALRHDGPGGRLTATSSGRWKACTWRYGSGPACTRTGAGAGSSPAQPAGPGAGASAMPEATCGRRSARGSDSSGTPLAGCAASSLRLCVCRRGQGAGAGLAGRSTADLRAGRGAARHEVTFTSALHSGAKRQRARLRSADKQRALRAAMRRAPAHESLSPFQVGLAALLGCSAGTPFERRRTSYPPVALPV